MPIIKSAKKRVLQAKKAYERNKHYNTRMRTMVKKVLKETDAEKAEKLLPETYSAIDVALKKNILHKNNAARKKARVAKVVATLKTTAVKKETKKEKVAEAKPKKTSVAKGKETTSKTTEKTEKKTTTAKKTTEKK